MESFEAEGAEGMTQRRALQEFRGLRSSIPHTSSLGRSLGLRGGNVQTFAQPLGCNAGGVETKIWFSGHLTRSLLGFEFASDPAAPFGKNMGTHGDEP